jgi:serine/threonine-protein kinase
VKVLDFGISKITASGADNPVLTKAAAMMGSPSYMSPEQMVAAGSVDVRADVWALGVVLYELLTGRLPFVAETMPELVGMILQHGYTPVSALRPDVPPGLQATIDRCLQKDRALRHRNVAELAAGLVPFGPPRSDLSLERIAHVLGMTGGAVETISASGPPVAQAAQTFSPVISSEGGRPGVVVCSGSFPRRCWSSRLAPGSSSRGPDRAAPRRRSRRRLPRRHRPPRRSRRLSRR